MIPHPAPLHPSPLSRLFHSAAFGLRLLVLGCVYVLLKLFFSVFRR